MSHTLQPAARERFHALDALRAGALLLGVAMHASMSFWPVPFWPIPDTHTSQSLFTFFLGSHIFRMSLFFMIAGFFAHMMLHKRGPGGFVKDRLKRIALPLVVFWPFLFGAFLAVIIWNAVRTGGGELPPPPQGAGLSLETLPLLHTWFLYVLLLLYAGALALHGVSRIVDRKGHVGRALDAAIGFLTKTHLLPVVLAAPLFAVFFFHQTWVPFSGIRTPDVGLVPNMAASVGFATAFGFGWLLHRQTELLSVWKRWFPVYLLAAVALSAVCVRTVMNQAPGMAPAGADVVTAAVYPLAIWAWSLGLTGLAMRVLARENKVVRYVADSSYWLYLIHLPVVMVGQVLIAQWDMPALVKFPLLVAGSVAAMLVSYQLLVRNTPLGGWLNGRRYGPKARAAMIPAATAAE